MGPTMPLELARHREARPGPGLDVLLIEDQHDIAANIWDFLERRGHRVDHAADGLDGLRRALSGQFDVIVLDLGLPRLDGLELCRRLRAAGTTSGSSTLQSKGSVRAVPVLMLTARDTLDDKLRGFSEGADDYLVKPFSMLELEVRIRALHRRQQPLAADLLQVGPLSYNPRAMLATRDSQDIPLTMGQSRILTTLLQESPNVVPHRQLMQSVWGEDGGDLAALHTHVHALRALVDRPFGVPLIHSVHGIGYRLALLSRARPRG